MKKNYYIMAVDTSCDDTSVAVTNNDQVCSNIISSQIKYHEEYGGVVPSLAKRMHQKLIEPTAKEALRRARVSLEQIDAIAVTVGPGLAPALEVGVAYARQLALKTGKPLIAVNHMEGHLLSALAKNAKGNNNFRQKKLAFPFLGLLISGGHTELVLAKKIGQYTLVGQTLDDAAGEAFDKLAKMLNLGYPGGPIISFLAKQGHPTISLPVPMQQTKDLNFSFSGLKTACLYKIKQQNGKFSRRYITDFAASFEKTVCQAVMGKLQKGITIYRPKQILLGGGVIANLAIRRETRKLANKYSLPVYVAYNKKLFTDNAAMIGVCAWYQAKRNDFVKDIEKVDRLPNLRFPS